MKFANLYVDSGVFKNMGEDMMINSIFNLYEYMGIKREDVIRIPVSSLRTYDEEDVILPLNYPFYGNFSISSKIHPVFLGISFLHKSIIDSMHLSEYEPIGCRDLHTYRLLQKEGIDSYINGCMTITLPRRERDNSANKVYLVDIPEELREYVPDWMKKNCVEKTQNFFGETVASCTEAFTRSQYEEYIQNARLVISSRLHCILPCAAAGIPTILTLKTKSFRYNWLENIMPIYTPENYNKIDWNPQPLEFEKEKKILLAHAASRIWAEYHQLTSRRIINKLYTNNLEDYSIDSMINAVTHMKKNWKKDRVGFYILWGVTQTAELLQDYIQKHYPYMKLKGIIDIFHKQKWRGVNTSSVDIIENNEDIVFVTAESANEYAIRYMSDKEINNYIICWDNPRTKLKDEKGCLVKCMK